MEKLVKSIIFDLDGTLVDTLPDIHAASNEMLKSVNLEPLQSKQVRSFIGNGIDKLIERCLNVYGVSRSKEAIRVFMEYYQANPTTLSKCYENVEFVLFQLKSRGLKLGICTNKPSNLTNKVLENLCLKKYFETIICGDTLHVKKPDARPLLEAVKGLESDPESSIFIGDSEVDMKTALSANIGFGFFTQGYHKLALGDICCDFHFDSYLELEKNRLLR
tara:strand:- start:653 stop:1309 length:657 start_codon:yes stop_codon:yes gene_type:complete